MNDVSTSLAAALLYGPDYKCFDASVAGRRITFRPAGAVTPFAAACLDPASPLVVVVLEGVQSGASNPVEAGLVADLVVALRDGLGYETDEAFFSRGVFIVSPHRAQIRAIRRELRPLGHDAFGARSVLNLCISVDHRALDGAEVGAFMQAVKAQLEAYSGDQQVY